MQLDSMKFALAATITIGLWYIICIIAVTVAPDASIALFRNIVHIVDTTGMIGNLSITPMSGFIGFLEVTIYSFLTTYVFAFLYNTLTEE